ncbi:hypothetical protein [Aurantiacibacter hainanensis]|uniref:hypothetical protein n=1 Tax=Aurantiacibacter hainanensis TaxID=3076114 RepID=UPI0030C747D3
MARGNIKGPLGPLMLALLVGVAVFMLYVVNNPEMDGWFDRPEGFYDNTFEKVGYALVFAAVVSTVIAIARRKR